MRKFCILFCIFTTAISVAQVLNCKIDFPEKNPTFPNFDDLKTLINQYDLALISGAGKPYLTVFMGLKDQTWECFTIRYNYNVETKNYYTTICRKVINQASIKYQINELCINNSFNLDSSPTTTLSDSTLRKTKVFFTKGNAEMNYISIYKKEKRKVSQMLSPEFRFQFNKENNIVDIRTMQFHLLNRFITGN